MEQTHIEVQPSEEEEKLELYQTRWIRFKLLVLRLWKDKAAIFGLMTIIILCLLCASAPFLTTYDPLKMNLPERLLPPSLKHPLGTDNYGRDVLTRLLYGGQISLSMGIVAVIFGLIPGILLGLISGFLRGKIDTIIMRGVDIMMSLPSIITALLIVTVLGPGILNTMIAIGIGGIPTMIRLVRSKVLSIRETEYVEAARSIGANDSRIMLKHILPNCVAPIIVVATLSLPSSIIMAASLSFIGLGAQEPTAEWGAMLATGRNFLTTSWWICTFPGLAIFLTVLSLNMFGDGLRDVLDPKLKN